MPLRVLEIGPGTGTFADSCLDFYKNYDLNMYRNCEYTFCEISSQLAEQCEKTMRQNHKQLFDEGRIKIYNGSIMDFDKKIDGSCFVIGLEILDNMPHDRLYTAGSQGLKQSQEMLSHASVVNIDSKLIGQKEESVTERLVPIQDLKDPLINLFLQIWNNMPEMDHITANKRLKSQGILKRLADGLFSISGRGGSQSKDTNENNVFAPTAALCLFQQIQKIAPKHMLILADFDSFLMPRTGCLKGVNAPMVTHKLKDPTQWTTYDNYLVERGHADICFPTDFFFLQHAYKHITGKSS